MRMNGPLSGTVGFRSVTDRTASINSTPIDHSTFQRDEIFEFQSFRSCQRALKIFLKIPPLPSLLSLSFHDKIWNPLEYIYIYIRSLKILESRFYYEKRNSRNYQDFQQFPNDRIFEISISYLYSYSLSFSVRKLKRSFSPYHAARTNLPLAINRSIYRLVEKRAKYRYCRLRPVIPNRISKVVGSLRRRLPLVTSFDRCINLRYISRSLPSIHRSSQKSFRPTFRLRSTRADTKGRGRQRRD